MIPVTNTWPMTNLTTSPSQKMICSFLRKEIRKIEVKRLTNCLKKQLKITNLFKYVYPYDNRDFMLNAQNFTDSSDDDNNTGAAAMAIE
jgi:hypothetical protein